MNIYLVSVVQRKSNNQKGGSVPYVVSKFTNLPSVIACFNPQKILNHINSLF